MSVYDCLVFFYFIADKNLITPVFANLSVVTSKCINVLYSVVLHIPSTMLIIKFTN